MSTAAITCPKCGVQNMSTSQFCGGCGNSIGAPVQPSQIPMQPLKAVAPAGSKDWHEKAGLICGIVSLFLCGILAAVPGLYFSWSALSAAKQQGRGTGLATTGIVLNGLGIVVTIAGIGLAIIVFAMAASAGQPDPMMEFNNMQNPYGY